MPKRIEEWITSTEAAKILSKNSGHTVSDAYVRQLGIAEKLITKVIDGRTKLYLKSDVEAYRVKARGTGEVRRAARTRKTVNPAA